MRLLLVLAAALALAAPALASDEHPTLAEIEGEVMCPTCHVTLDMSDAPIAKRMEAFIQRRIAAGDTKSEIEAKLVAQFGPQILAAPPKRGFDLLAWWLPIAGAVAGALVLGWLVWWWSRRRPALPAAPGTPAVNGRGLDGPDATELDPDLERRLDEELARFDAS